MAQLELARAGRAFAEIHVYCRIWQSTQRSTSSIHHRLSMAEEPPPSEHYDLQSKHDNARICRVESARPILLRRARLPPELIDMIIDLLHTDQAALTTCALVCRSWVPASRLHLFPLFSEFYIHSATKKQVRILSSPLCTIASAVQHVVVEKTECRRNLLALFSRLSKTTQLTLRSRRETTFLQLQDCSPRLEFALAPLSQQLECLVLQGIQFDTLDSVFSLLRSFPRLQRVACSYVSFKILFNERHLRTLPTDQGFHMPELRVLEMHCSGRLLSRLVERWGNAIPQLTMLRTDLRDEFGLSTLMETVGSSLKRLEISGLASDFCEWPQIILAFV
jgi:hypothetical protein